MTEISIARVLFLLFFAAIGVAVCFVRGDYVFRGAPGRERWRDLRLWAIVLVLIHVAVYWIF